jgi:hypothetical protein
MVPVSQEDFAVLEADHLGHVALELEHIASARDVLDQARHLRIVAQVDLRHTEQAEVEHGPQANVNNHRCCSGGQ